MTTNDIDQAVHEAIVAKGAYPSPLGYGCFPRSCTTSVNNVIAREPRCPFIARLNSRRIANDYGIRRYPGRVSHQHIEALVAHLTPLTAARYCQRILSTST